MYPTAIYGFGWGHLPRNVEELGQSTEACACCMKVGHHYRFSDCDVNKKFCKVHMFGAVFTGEISFSEGP